jgi:hypothetical protein
MRDKLIELYGNHTEEGLLFVDGLDNAIIGICPETLRVVYSRNKVIEVFMEEEFMEEDDAIEHAEYNTFNTYVGEQTPIWVDDLTYKF